MLKIPCSIFGAFFFGLSIGQGDPFVFSLLVGCVFVGIGWLLDSRLTRRAPDLGKATDYKPDPIEVYYPDTEQTKECGWCHQMNKESNTNCWACEGEI